MNIIVKRSPADRPTTINVPLIADDLAALQRGETELEKGEQKRDITISMRFDESLRVGQVIKVIDPTQPSAIYGRIKSIGISIDAIPNPARIMEIVLEESIG